MSDAEQPWEKQKGESRQAFEAFGIYRDMGPSRSLRKVAEKLSKSQTLMKRWSERWSWVARTTAWDAELDQKKCESQEKARIDMAERHAKTAMMLQQKVLERMQSLNPDSLTPNDVVRWIEVAVKIERLSRGAPSEIEKQEYSKAPSINIIDTWSEPDE